MMEHWKPVPGYESLYDVSDHGRVRSYLKQGRSGGPRETPQRIMKIWLQTCGRFQVHLVNEKGIRVTHLVHRLVAGAFLGPCPDGQEVNHKNGNHQDNRIQNLEYVTRSENMAHAFANKLIDHKGEKNPRAKLSLADVRVIRRLYATGDYTQSGLAERYEVGASQVARIVNHQEWAECEIGKVHL